MMLITCMIPGLGVGVCGLGRDDGEHLHDDGGGHGRAGELAE